MKKELKKRTNLMEVVADYITISVNKRLKKDGLELQKMKLGFEILLINISKFIIVFLVAYQFNLLKEAFFMSLIFAWVRSSAFGLHAKSSIVCTITSLIMFVFGAHIAYYIKLNNYVVFGMFLLLILLLYKYAPGDTEKHPLLGSKLRKKLRKDSVLTGIIMMILALLIPSQVSKSMILMAVSYEIVTILPITYKLLKRGYNNYEIYERPNC